MLTMASILRTMRLQLNVTDMDECMKCVEKFLSDSFDKHAKELKSLKDAHDKHAEDV